MLHGDCFPPRTPPSSMVCVYLLRCVSHSVIRYAHCRRVSALPPPSAFAAVFASRGIPGHHTLGPFSRYRSLIRFASPRVCKLGCFAPKPQTVVPPAPSEAARV